VVELPHSKHEALSSNPTTTLKKKNNLPGMKLKLIILLQGRFDLPGRFDLRGKKNTIFMRNILAKTIIMVFP
jgi:hypothetical protein